MNTRQKLHQLRMNEWATRFSDQKASGLTVKEWCGQNDLSIHTYNYWKHALKEELARLFPHGYKELPDEIYRRLHIIPEPFIVDEHHVHVYASKDNDGTIVKAPRGTDLFRNSIATPSLVASIINGKYNNALPLERQARAYRDNGINLATNTMANWVIKSVDNYLSLLYDRLHDLIYENHIIHADETPVKVMRIDNNKIKNGKKTYMWVYRNRQTEETRPIVLFDWPPSRKADHPRDFLKNFSGTVITDGYQVYRKLSRERDDLPTFDRLKQRQLILTEKVDAYFAWVKLKYTQVSHNSTIGKALAYSIHQESYLRTFLNDGDVPMDNNYAEQAIRPFTIGRKNFVLIESSNGARASAMICSIVETAKANYLNVYQYFELLLTEIPKRMNDTDLKFIDELLPWAPHVQETCPSRFKKS